MRNCNKSIVGYHNKEATLLQKERTAMRDRRNANRDRLKGRLKNTEKPLPEEFIKQGSYAMLTMVKDSGNDYDIDDGVYYRQEQLRDSEGVEMTPCEVREMICKALQGGRFNDPPSVKTSCVRIQYQEGYHVDMPIYKIRESDDDYELAAGDEWVVSRAADVEQWFNDANQELSPDEKNGRQFRRIVRLLKKFVRSREDWKPEIASGFTVTKLAQECYVAALDRDDKALRDTMRRIRDRLQRDLEVSHPVTPGAKLTDGPSDPKTMFFRQKLDEALDDLENLDDLGCTEEEANAAWDNVFNTDWFSQQSEVKKSEENSVQAGLASLLAMNANPRAVEKRGGGRYA